jgi:hypothetical protein
MAGLSQTDFDQMKAELDREWAKAMSRDDGLRVIISFGQRFGYKNVMAALQGKVPKRFSSGVPLDEWKAEQRAAEREE